MESYSEPEFRTKIDAALRRVRAVLENTRNPQVPADVPHRYDDKYLLAEVLTRVAAASLLQCLEALDTEGAVRATILNPGDVWTRSAQKGLLGAPSTASLFAKEQKDEKNKAFDLLDALSKSGALAIEDASLHVVIAATHCFDRTLLDTVIQANVNPIEKVERSLLIVGTTIHGRPAAELLAEDQRDRFFTTSPQLGPATEG